MLKLIKLSGVLSAVAVIVSLPQAVFSRPLSESSGYPVERNSTAGSLFCYMRTQRGVVLNLENLCRADDGSGSPNRAANAASNPATTPAANSTPNRRVYTFIGTPGGDVTPNGTNTSANGNPNATNTNLTGTNSNTNSNPNGNNTNGNSNFGGTNTGSNSNFGGTNTGSNSNFGSTNTSTNNQR